MPQAIQVAFQGGGARFVEMLPIAHALAEAHRLGTIRITRVSGSSAGSICAALIACDADFKKVRKYLIDEGPVAASQMRRWSSRASHGELAPLAGKIKVLFLVGRALLGWSLLRQTTFVDFLAQLFATANADAPQTIEAINHKIDGIKLVITGSNLLLSQGTTFASGTVTECIANSCAIPFAFRTFSDIASSPHVDGGLCENLPVEELLKHEDDDGPVFCVAIEEDFNRQNQSGDDAATTMKTTARNGDTLPKNLKDYCLQLVSASINHNVERAKRLVGKNNILQAHSTLTTFDFERAIRKIDYSSDFYRSAFDGAQAKILKLSQLYSNVGDPTSSNLHGRLSAPKIMNSLFRVFESSLQQPAWSFQKSAFVVRAECLWPDTINATRSADYVVRIATIVASGPNLVCITSSADLDPEGAIIPTAWTCYNETRQHDVTVHAIPVRNPADQTRGSVTVLVFFENPAQSIAQGDVVTVKSHYLLDRAMEKLKSEKSDYIRVTNPHPIPIAHTDIVLVYPVSFPQISARGTRDEDQIPQSRIQSEYLNATSTGYKAAGLTTRNLAPGGEFKALFYAS